MYFDGSVAEASLDQRLEASQREIARLKRENEMLMGECERHMSNSRAHALKEKDAMVELNMLRLELAEQKGKTLLQDAKKNRDQWKRKYANLREIVRETQWVFQICLLALTQLSDVLVKTTTE